MGAGLLGKKGKSLLSFEEGKGEVSGGEFWGIGWPLRDALDSRTLFCSLLNWKDEEEEGRTVSQVEEKSGFWFLSGFALIALDSSLWVAHCQPLLGVEGRRLKMRRSCRYARAGSLKSTASHCS